MIMIKFFNYSSIKNVPYFKNGHKIHIKKSHKGLFTEYCGGNVTDECIQRGKNSSDPKIRKRATFAANVRKWNRKGLYGLKVHSPKIQTYVTEMTNPSFAEKVLKKYVK